MNRPTINVTPLIDVLLVLLIIFMVVSPLKPSDFKARVPSEPKNVGRTQVSQDTLVTVIGRDGSIRLNGEAGLGSVSDTAKLIDRLREVFQARVENGGVSQTFAADTSRPYSDRAERTVFIKAPRGLSYGKVAAVVDAVKLGGAFPISLQIDDLD